MPVTATVNVSVSYGGFQRLAPKPAPAPNRPDEYWWIEWCEGMPLQPACLSFEGDTPAKIQQLGDDSWGTPLEEVPHIKLVERIAPVGSEDELRSARDRIDELETVVERLRSAADRLA